MSSMLFSKVPSLSLNEGNAVGENTQAGSDPVFFTASSGGRVNSVPDPRSLAFDFPLSDPDILGSVSGSLVSKPLQRRDFLDSLLRRRFGGVLSKKDSDFLRMYRDYARGIFSVSDSQSFDYCHYNERKGRAFISKKDNGRTVYPFVPRCSQKGCLRCDSHERDKVLREWVEYIENIAVFHKSDFPGIYTGVFDLPSELEAIPLYDRSVAARLIQGIQQIYRKAFGCKSDKAGVGNIGILAFEHPCGDSDLFRDRWHLHVDVIPCVVSGTDSKKYKVKAGDVRWLSLSPEAQRKLRGGSSGRVPAGHVDFDWLLDQWRSLLISVFPDYDFSSFRKLPQWDFIPNDSSFGARINHRILYDGRRFSEDVRKSVVRTDIDGCSFVVRCECGKTSGGVSDFYYWRYVSAQDFVLRYLFLRDSCRMHSLGWCHLKSRYEIYFCGVVLVQKTLSFSDLLDPDQYYEVELDIVESVHYRFRCGKILKELTTSYIFFNPCTGIVESRSFNQMSCLRL